MSNFKKGLNKKTKALEENADDVMVDKELLETRIRLLAEGVPYKLLIEPGMDIIHREKLKRNRTYLEDEIDFDNIQSGLLENNVLTTRQRNKIRDKPKSQQIGEFLDILAKSGPEAYHKFRHTLKRYTHYTPVVKVLDETKIEAKMLPYSPGAQTEESEKRYRDIVGEAKQCQKRITDTTATVQKTLNDEHTDEIFDQSEIIQFSTSALGSSFYRFNRHQFTWEQIGGKFRGIRGDFLCAADEQNRALYIVTQTTLFTWRADDSHPIQRCDIKPPLSKPLLHARACFSTANEEIIICGGKKDGLSTYSVKLDGSCFPLCDMLKRRENPGLTELGGVVYATGGYRNGKAVKDCEKLNPKTNKWEKAESKVWDSWGHGQTAAEDNKRMYAVLNTLEAFDPRSGKWEEISELKTKLEGLGLNFCVCSGQYLWIFNTRVREIVFRYDIALNKITPHAVNLPDGHLRYCHIFALQNTSGNKPESTHGNQE